MVRFTGMSLHETVARFAASLEHASLPIGFAVLLAAAGKIGWADLAAGLGTWFVIQVLAEVLRVVGDAR